MARPTRKSRRKAEARGRQAETFAALFLQAKLYTILDRRVRLPMGEVDLIAKRGSILAFVEVKQRPTRALCQQAVPPQSWQRIARTAESWAGKRGFTQDLDWRYDLIAVTPFSLPHHFKDYWRP
ncbi:YraN family protein [Hyphomonas sp. FCG-A18]|uniref:YraN family protein n=1 Tax=Hyphomonas sp. FCG-A18 TaxID=3080019 RepID=UPI002B2CBE76|nr:YraN family protein [Hyphomonas sp. FCG-A18]